jgi:glucokinase
MSEKLILGVDIGGTKVAVGLVNEAGEIIAKTRVPMISNSTAEAAMECVHRAIEAGMRLGPLPVQSIGVSSPGPLDPKTGVILHTPNLPCWRNFSLLAEIERRYALPVRLENDANAAGLAEARWGAAQNFSSVFYVTVGTGVGTAIIQQKSIYHGRTGAAAEGGHMTIDYKAPIRCGCGKRGCLESMAAGPGIAARAQEQLSRNGAGDGAYAALAGNTPVTAESVFDACDAGDPVAQAVVQETVELLAVWLGNVVDLLEPEVIVIGGGVGTRMAKWLPKLQSSLLRWTINPRANEIPLLPASYGADSGIAGSAALWLPESVLAPYLAVSKLVL